jgi:hypothetical protein
VDYEAEALGPQHESLRQELVAELDRQVQVSQLS